MINNGPFVLFLIVAVIALMLATRLSSWIAKLVFFFVTLGAASMAAGAAALDVGWTLLIYVAVFIAVGVTAVRLKNTGNRVLGATLTIVGVLLIFPAFGGLGSSVPGSIGNAIVESFGEGWDVFLDTVQLAIGRT